MKKILGKIIYSILKGEDYREFVLATINKRFVDTVEELMQDVFIYKLKGNDWLKSLIQDTSNKTGKRNKHKLLWFGGLNEKTVKNMVGTVKKEVCLEIGKENINAFKALLKERQEYIDYHIIIKIKHDEKHVQLDEIESILFLNIVATMKLTVQGGAWSEVGKTVENALLFTIFELIKIPNNDIMLIYSEMKEKDLVENREIDALVFKDSKSQEYLTVECKLLGIGNPEIADEAFARKSDLFLVDRLTDMMKEEADKINVKVIEFRQENSLQVMYDFFKSNGVKCEKPKKYDDETLMNEITQHLQSFNESGDAGKILKKLKELTS